MGKISAETEALLSRAMAFKEKNPKISIAQAARQFGVQKDLLRRRLIGVRPAKGKKPAYRLFSDGEEAALVDYINRYYGSNYPLSKEAIVSFANGILRARCHSVDQDPLVVGKNWVTRFLARKEYTVLHQKTLDARKRKAENADVVNAWFLRLEETISKYGIVDADIWNVNEMVFQLHVEDGQMVATTEPKLAKRTTFETRDTATLIESASAAGETCPLYVVFKGAEHLANWRDVSDVRPPMQVSVSSTRWNTDRIQLDWIDLFHRQTEKYRIGKHCLLLLDGFGSHHTKEFMDKCEEYHIHPFVFPSNTTHLVQPLDASIFQWLKLEYSKHLLAAHRDGFNDGMKESFLSNVAQVRKKALRSEVVKSTFKKAGIVPLDRTIVLSKLPAPPPTPERPSTPPVQDADESSPSPPGTPRTYHRVKRLCDRINKAMKGTDTPRDVLEDIAILQKVAIRDNLHATQVEGDHSMEEETRSQRNYNHLARSFNLQLGGSMDRVEARHVTDNLEQDEAERVAKAQARAQKRVRRMKSRAANLRQRQVSCEAREQEDEIQEEEEEKEEDV